MKIRLEEVGKKKQNNIGVRDFKSPDMSSIDSLSSGDHTNETTKITPYISNSPPPDYSADSPDSSSRIDADLASLSNLNLTVNDYVGVNGSGAGGCEVVNSENLSFVDEKSAQNEAPEEANADEDDEWADFVEPNSSNIFIPATTTTTNANDEKSTTSITAQLENIPEKSVPLPTHPPPTPPSPSTIQTQQNQLLQQQQQQSFDKSVDFDLISSSEELVNRIFQPLTNRNNQKIGAHVDDGGGNRVGEIVIDDDECWKSLKEFTCVNDASSSLKFRWLFSELENSFLSSINIQRENITSNAAQQVRKTDMNFHRP